MHLPTGHFRLSTAIARTSTGRVRTNAYQVVGLLSINMRGSRHASADTQSFYKRKLPTPPCIEFSSKEGKKLFREAWDEGFMEAFFPLIEQFKTQDDPTFCGLTSVAVALNALQVDPGRVWKAPWRWHHETTLACCDVEALKRDGTTFSQVASLARCNGAHAELVHASNSTVDCFRAKVIESCRSDAPRQFIISSYHRGVLSQTGTGHFSPIGGYHPEQDLVLILDVARFKYPPHWVKLPLLFQAMMEEDEATHRSRGYILLQGDNGPAGKFFFSIKATEEHRWCMVAHWLQATVAKMHGNVPLQHPVGHHSHTKTHHLCHPSDCSHAPVANANGRAKAGDDAGIDNAVEEAMCQISGPSGFVKSVVQSIPQEVGEMISTYRRHNIRLENDSQASISRLISEIENTQMFDKVKDALSESNSTALLLEDSTPSDGVRAEHFLTVWILACGTTLAKRLPENCDWERLSLVFDTSALSDPLIKEITHVGQQLDALLEESLCNTCPSAILFDDCYTGVCESCGAKSACCCQPSLQNREDISSSSKYTPATHPQHHHQIRGALPQLRQNSLDRVFVL